MLSIIGFPHIQQLVCSIEYLFLQDTLQNSRVLPLLSNSLPHRLQIFLKVIFNFLSTYRTLSITFATKIADEFFTLRANHPLFLLNEFIKKCFWMLPVTFLEKKISKFFLSSTNIQEAFCCIHGICRFRYIAWFFGMIYIILVAFETKSISSGIPLNYCQLWIFAINHANANIFCKYALV